MLIPTVHAKGLREYFKEKNFETVAKMYNDEPAADYTEKEYVIISYSLRKLDRYRDDVKVIIKLVKKFYTQKHKELLTSIKDGKTIDGDDVPEPLKIHYWNLLADYSKIITKQKEKSNSLTKDHSYFKAFSKILSEVEFREAKVDKINDAVIAHFQWLENKIYHFKSSLYVQYVSWQQTGHLRSPTEVFGLIITNQGTCLGGDIGIENYLFHFYLDGCYLYGSGGVQSLEGINYQQSNLPAYGAKIGPGISMIVSSSKSRIGIKFPLLYSTQKLTAPTEPGYTISENSQTTLLTTLYSRWQFDKWYISTEFGKYVNREETFWGLGAGREF